MLNDSDFPDLSDPIFREIANRWLGTTLLSVERLWGLYEAVRGVVQGRVPGDIVECGTFKGGSAGFMLDTLVSLFATDQDVYLFDTFDGFPEGLDELMIDGQRFRRGDWITKSFRAEFDGNVARTKYPSDKIKICAGRVQDTIVKAAPSAIALLHLDTDYYEATIHQLNVLYPRLVRGGFIQIDDYGHFLGCRRATDEYIAKLGTEAPALYRIDYTGRAGRKP